MGSASEIYAPMGTTADYGTAAALDGSFVSPGKLFVRRLVVHYVDAADTTNATDWELYVNGSDSGIKFIGSKDAAAATGYVLGSTGRFQCKDGDLLEIYASGDDTGTGDAHATLVLAQ